MDVASGDYDDDDDDDDDENYDNDDNYDDDDDDSVSGTDVDDDVDGLKPLPLSELTFSSTGHSREGKELLRATKMAEVHIGNAKYYCLVVLA